MDPMIEKMRKDGYPYRIVGVEGYEGVLCDMLTTAAMMLFTVTLTGQNAAMTWMTPVSVTSWSGRFLSSLMLHPPVCV